MTVARVGGKTGARSLTKSQRAYESIRRMIISHRFLPEHRWSLRKLALRLRMSVVPVSEAVRRLEQEDILQVSPQRGIRLVPLTAGRLRELRIVREGLEVQAIAQGDPQAADIAVREHVRSQASTGAVPPPDEENPLQPEGAAR